jgi:carbamoyl-phosphate synthase large subunit
VAAVPVCKLHEGRPNIVDAIVNKQVQLVINTPIGKHSGFDDSYIRKTAIRCKVPYVTTMAAALASVRGIAAAQHGITGVKSLQAYHAGIR